MARRFLPGKKALGAPPQRDQGSAFSCHRIGSRNGNVCDGLQNSGRGCLAAKVRVLSGRIATDHQQISARLETAMPGSGREHSDVACGNRHFSTRWSAEQQARPARSESQHLMRGGMVMMKGINPIAPLRRPAVFLEETFQCLRGLFIAFIGHGGAVKKHREIRMIGDAVAGRQQQGFRLHIQTLTVPAGGTSCPHALRVRDPGLSCGHVRAHGCLQLSLRTRGD